MRIEHQPSKLRVAGSSPAGRAKPRLTCCCGCSGGRSSVGRAPDCGSGRRGFESHRPPQKPLYRQSLLSPSANVFGPLAQLVEQLTLNQLVVGSSPTRPTIFFQTPAPSPFPAALASPAAPHPRFLSRRGVVLYTQYQPIDGHRVGGCCGTGYGLVARVAELVDALDLGSSGATRESSSLSFRTIPAGCREIPAPALERG